MAAGRTHSSVVVLDDDANLLDIISQHFEELEGQVDVITFTSSARALHHLLDHTIDLALVKFRLPELDGYAVARAITNLRPETAVLLIADRSDGATISSALECGASGIIDHPFTRSQLCTAVIGALNGHFIGNRGTLIFPKRHPIPVGWGAFLSLRQRTVAALILRGLTNKQISTTLGIATATAHTHVQAIFRTLGVSSRKDLLHLADRSN